jgi:4-hydroxybenzoate polyprenyltransferase
MRIFHGFIKYDYATGFIPPSLFVLAIGLHYHLSATTLLLDVGKAVLIFAGYIYAFCLSNQLADISEDRINKPSRPLPTGLVTREQAWTRLVFVLVCYAALAQWFGVAWWVLLWQAALLLHNQGRFSWHWLGKNVIMGIGTLAQLAAAWCLVMPLTETGWRWVPTLSVVIFTLIPLQDLRDIAGDMAVGRRTFPIVFGKPFTRAYVAVGFCLLPLLIHIQLMAPREPDPYVIFADLTLGAWAVLIAARTIAFRTPRADHLTYTLWTLWYTTTLATAWFAL